VQFASLIEKHLERNIRGAYEKIPDKVSAYLAESQQSCTDAAEKAAEDDTAVGKAAIGEPTSERASELLVAQHAQAYPRPPGPSALPQALEFLQRCLPSSILEQLSRCLLAEQLSRCLPAPQPTASLDAALSPPSLSLPSLSLPSLPLPAPELAERPSETHIASRVIDFDDSQGHTLYRVVTDATIAGVGTFTSTSARRYSDFRALHRQVSQPLRLPHRFPVPKRLFHSQAAKQRRMRGLQNYLTSCSIHVMDCAMDSGGEPLVPPKAVQSAVLTLLRFLDLPDRTPPPSEPAER